MPGKCSCTIFPGMTVLKNQLIVCVANAAWSGDYAKSTVEVMKVLGRQNTVVYVDPPYTVKDIATELYRRKPVPLKRLFGISSRLELVKQEAGGTVYRFFAPPQWPAQFLDDGVLFRFFTKLNAFFFRRSVKAALKRLQINQPPVLVVAFNPYAGLQLVGNLQEKALLYYCYDEIAHAAWISKHGVRLEKQLMQRADAVFVSSVQLMQNKQADARHIYLLKNGVNTHIFSQAFRPLPVTGRRCVGFIGSLDSRVDYDLLLAIVQALPAWQFSFTGRLMEQEAFKPIQEMPNVRWTPSVVPEALPEVLASFDVGIIPFAKTGFTKAIYPLKINEYLMAGIPVVTTRFTDLDDFESFCLVADESSQFAKSIEQAVDGDSEAKRQHRFEFARKNDWQERCKVFDLAASQLAAFN